MSSRRNANFVALSQESHNARMAHALVGHAQQRQKVIMQITLGWLLIISLDACNIINTYNLYSVSYFKQIQ